MKLNRRCAAILLLFTVPAIRPAAAEDVYYKVPFKELTFNGGGLPTNQERSPVWSMNLVSATSPYAALDGEGEAYVGGIAQSSPWMPQDAFFADAFVAVRGPQGKDVTGHIFLPKTDYRGMTMLGFKIPAKAAKTGAKKDFFEAKRDHYRQLLNRDLPGAAWFRHEEAEAAKAGGLGTNSPANEEFSFRRGARPMETDDTYSLFGGGRAVSENLQLDRAMLATKPGDATVDLASLTGITVKEMDWKPLIKDAKPETDPLAACVPADQHAIFFRSFQAMTRMMDEADSNGTPLLQMFEPRAEDRDCKGRYQKQLCLGLSEISRMLGPQVVDSVAFTGSDPYLRVGTDLGILFEAKSPEALKAFIIARQAATAQGVPEAKAVRGEIDGTSYVGVVSPDRAISSYVASRENVVFVANSTYQLGRLLSTAKGKTPALLSQDEYTFFRARYSRADKQETAFLVLSDATIRRWCGPQWRIADSRRTRALAVMTELQAAHFEELAAGKIQPGPLKSDLLPADAGEVTLTKNGVTSTVYGSLDFLTPIAELPMAKVTKSEADSYKRWRDTYQQNWNQFFDPIAARFSISSNQVGVELTVMPLIMRTEYDEMLRLTSGAAIAPGAGDPHPGTVAHLAMALNSDSEPVKEASSFLKSMSLGIQANALAWVGQCVALYADEDSFWDRLAKADKPETFLEKEYFQLPVALYCEVKNPLGAAAFLTALRAYADQSAPGMATWSTQDYNGRPYVKVTAKSRNGEPGELDKLAIYYAVTPKSLTVTLNEGVLKRALDRQAATNAPSAAPAWLGTNFCLRLDRRFLSALQPLFGGERENTVQILSWNNLPVLNEWKRRFPTQDPVKLHEQFWQTKLVCPGGGNYVWNEKWQTMESTVYGHPGEPKKGPPAFGSFRNVSTANLGLSFENRGLSAKAVLTRDN